MTRVAAFETMDSDQILHEVVPLVRDIDGVRAIVLGGSRARGTHHAGSDYDIGIYYDPAEPINVLRLSEVAQRLDDQRREDLVTTIGGWGPWINGGGWLKVQGRAVDFLFRDLAKVRDCAQACLRGDLEIYYQPGHPFGFLNSMYVAELSLCRVLWEDAANPVTQVKQEVWPYPKCLQDAHLGKFLWEAEFSLGIGEKAVAKHDVVYAAGCCFRSAMCLLQVLFAMNGVYWMNEKGAVSLANEFRIKPERLAERLNDVFTSIAEIPASLKILRELYDETVALTGQSSASP